MEASPESELLLERIDELRVQIETLQENLAYERSRVIAHREASRAWKHLHESSTFTHDEVVRAQLLDGLATDLDARHA